MSGPASEKLPFVDIDQALEEQGRLRHLRNPEEVDLLRMIYDALMQAPSGPLAEAGTAA